VDWGAKRFNYETDMISRCATPELFSGVKG